MPTWAMVIDTESCIGCHACETACSEKNDNPAHIAFRSVGYVEGGTYPDYQRINISMACNHCDDYKRDNSFYPLIFYFRNETGTIVCDEVNSSRNACGDKEIS